MGTDPKSPILKRKRKQPSYKADYQGATPEQVAEAILRYRPVKEADPKSPTLGKPAPKR